MNPSIRVSGYLSAPQTIRPYAAAQRSKRLFPSAGSGHELLYNGIVRPPGHYVYGLTRELVVSPTQIGVRQPFAPALRTRTIAT